MPGQDQPRSGPPAGPRHAAPGQPPVRPVFPGLTITPDKILPVVSMSTLLQAIDALREL